MTKLTNIRNIIGLVLIILALWTPNNNPQPIDLSSIVIDKPSQNIIELVSPISQEIKDPTDRIKLAIFNQEFANKIKLYDADLQNVNDVYVLAASYFFENTLVNKYENLDTTLKGLIEYTTGSDNHKLTDQEKEKLSESFSGLAWSLIQKR